MSDYISREAAFDAVRKVHNPNTARAVMSVVALRELPAADVVEVVHGEWLKGIHVVECSACSDFFDFGDETWVDDYDIVADIGWKHCPNCGAKMDGGADG